MLLAEIKDEQDPDEKDKRIESLKEAYRNKSLEVANLLEWRDHYKRLYEQLLDEVLNRVNRE